MISGIYRRVAWRENVCDEIEAFAVLTFILEALAVAGSGLSEE
jgi:hypothetical protein